MDRVNPPLFNCWFKILNQVLLFCANTIIKILGCRIVYKVFLTPPRVFTDIPVFIQTQEKNDFASLSNIRVLSSEFAVQESDFQELPDDSFVILDDFSFNSRISKNKTKADFLRVINYYLRHHNIKLCLIIHNLFNNNLFTEILLAPHIFLSYSNLGYYVIR